MAFSLKDRWVWDLWLADDGERYHMFYLNAPRALLDPDLRHRNARIGHATSTDLVAWDDQGTVLGPGAPGDFDETATWTGSVVRGPDGLWRMFYTGSRFLSADSMANVETVGMATSPDLFAWTRRDGFVLGADPRLYETLGTSTWTEEAWRDPWVYADPGGDGWHMLITARVNYGDVAGRGVVGHATSPDLDTWTVQSPRSAPQAGFGHLEVPQVVRIGDRDWLLFSCNTPRLNGAHMGRTGGIWAAPAASAAGPFDIGRASLLVHEDLYAGRLIENRAGQWVLLAFENGEPFRGGICDPIAVEVDGDRLGLGSKTGQAILSAGA